MNFSSSEQASSGQASSQTVETQLSKAQASILKSREKQYQEVFFPELKAELEEASLATVDQPTLRESVAATNRAAQQAGQQFTQDIAQRGLEGSGAEVQGLAALSGARQSALSTDFFRAKEAAKQRKLGILQMGGALAPTPTTAAPMGQVSSSFQEAGGQSRAFGL